MPGFAVAGKTGTSQKLDQGEYSRSKVVASFAGFVPAEDPCITVVVMIDEPQKMKYGGEIAAPAFSGMARGILNYLHVAPAPQVQEESRPAGRTWQETKINAPNPQPLG